MKSIEELKSRLEEATKETSGCKSVYEDIKREIRNKVDEYTKQLYREYEPQITEAQEQISIATEAEDKIRREISEIHAAKSSQSGIIGKTVTEWKREFGWMESRPTGLRGIVEVFKDGDSHIGAEYSKPMIGKLVVRVLKSDGKPSKRCIEFMGHVEHGNQSLPYGWKLENE